MFNEKTFYLVLWHNADNSDFGVVRAFETKELAEAAERLLAGHGDRLKCFRIAEIVLERQFGAAGAEDFTDGTNN